MTSVRPKGEKVRRFIVSHVAKHPHDIARVTAEHFDISRQAVNRHLQRLVDDQVLMGEGKTSGRVYRLRPLVNWATAFDLTETREEHLAWRNRVAPQLEPLPDNAMDIWQYGFTEMLNNAIDHSGGDSVVVRLTRTAAHTSMTLADNGVGIFRKIKRELGLADERHAILELAKGKLTTDPKRHTGEGIFFTSRVFDDFAILSGDTFFTHKFGEREDWILETDEQHQATVVFMTLNNHTSRTMNKVFERFASSEDDFAFSRTVVPVKMAQYGDDLLISRSQAKRLLARLDRFAVVVFDFNEVKQIGQAFADEVFRVFAEAHPDISLEYIHANSAVKRMIHRAIQGRTDIEGQGRLFGSDEEDTDE